MKRAHILAPPTLQTTCKVLCLIMWLLAMAGIANAQSPGTRPKDPDLMVDPVNLVTSRILPAPDVTLGDNDATVAGVAGDPVGIDDSLTNPPADPADDSPSGQTFYVDNTPSDGDCPATPYTTIQAAVNASGPNDTVKVCPGTYPEQVRIMGHAHDYLKLESLKPLQAVIAWPTIESPPLALVDFNTADHVTLRGFTITGPFTFPACSPERHEGVLVENASDEHIHHNHITMIENSSVLLLRGCQEGDAVAIGHRVSITSTCQGTVPGSAHVDHNLIDEYQKNGVQIFNQGTVASVDHNEITGPSGTIQPHAASNGLVVFCAAVATVDHNVISNNHFTGSPLLASSGGVIFAEAPANSSELEHNSIFDNDYGIETETQQGLEISHNDVFKNLTDAITVCGDIAQFCGPAMQIVVRKNDATSNGGSGILLLGAVSNLLKSNHVSDNGTAGPDTTDGIRVDATSTTNQIVDNHMIKTVTHDCHDDSTGTGTAGTANTWTNDMGNTQNHAGLCQPNEEDEGEAEDSEHDSVKFQDSQSNPQNSQMQYQDPSQNMNVQSVNGARSITYNGSCVSFITDAVVNGNPGYVANFAACDLSVLGLGIGTFSMNITGPLGFLYQKNAALTSGYVSIHPH